jgi:Tfp pilus assembly protein PilN
MSVRVNLLPEATKQRGRANQQRLMALGAAGLLLLVLGGTWWWAANQVSQAEDRLAAEQSVTAGLRAEEAELIAFRDLADRREQAVETLIVSMADEVSIAGVLQDLAAVMPADAQMDTLTVTIQRSEERADVMGNLVVTGQTLTSHAPGVERMLLALEKVSTFGELYLNSSTLDPEQVDPVATFSLEGAVRSEARTDRYVDGLPGDLR